MDGTTLCFIFFHLLAKHFPLHHKLHRIINKNKVKISYSLLLYLSLLWSSSSCALYLLYIVLYLFVHSNCCTSADSIPRFANLYMTGKWSSQLKRLCCACTAIQSVQLIELLRYNSSNILMHSSTIILLIRF